MQSKTFPVLIFHETHKRSTEVSSDLFHLYYPKWTINVGNMERHLLISCIKLSCSLRRFSHKSQTLHKFRGRLLYRILWKSGQQTKRGKFQSRHQVTYAFHFAGFKEIHNCPMTLGGHLLHRISPKPVKIFENYEQNLFCAVVIAPTSMELTLGQRLFVKTFLPIFMKIRPTV